MPFRTSLRPCAFTLWLCLTSLDTRAARELPDPAITPGATNTQVSPSNIDTTACQKGGSRTVRPPVSYTNRIEHIVMHQYGYDREDIHAFELDHLIPLSLGGAPDDPKNLSPEPHVGDGTADDKDALEAQLHHLVCDCKSPLAEPQSAIRTNWISAYRR